MTENQNLEELLERVARLEEAVFGMDVETARRVLEAYDNACRESDSWALRHYNDPVITKAEKVLGA